MVKVRRADVARDERPRAGPVGRGGGAGRQQPEGASRARRDAWMPPRGIPVLEVPTDPGGPLHGRRPSRAAIRTTPSTRAWPRRSPPTSSNGLARVAPQQPRRLRAEPRGLPRPARAGAWRRWTETLAPFKGARVVVVPHRCGSTSSRASASSRRPRVEERPGHPATPASSRPAHPAHEGRADQGRHGRAVERPEARRAGRPRRRAPRWCSWPRRWAAVKGADDYLDTVDYNVKTLGAGAAVGRMAGRPPRADVGAVPDVPGPHRHPRLSRHPRHRAGGRVRGHRAGPDRRARRHRRVPLRLRARDLGVVRVRARLHHPGRRWSSRSRAAASGTCPRRR